MASLHIAEFAGLGAGAQSTDILAAPAVPNATQIVATGSASAALQPTTSWVKLTAGGPMSIAIGLAPVAAIGGWFLSSGETVWVRVPAGLGYQVAQILDTP
jgi:hypothetical protein